MKDNRNSKAETSGHIFDHVENEYKLAEQKSYGEINDYFSWQRLQFTE